MCRVLRSLVGLLTVLFISLTATSQIAIDTTMTPEELVQNVLLGNGVSVSNITFNGQPANQLNAQIARFSGESNFVEFPEAVVLKSGHAFDIQDPNFFPPFTFPNPDITGDQDLLDISGQFSVNNCAILEFDFVPNGDSLQFRYVFASNEYPGFTCSTFNDAFGFFISGPGINGPFSNNAMNIALVPDTDIPVAINTINSGVSSSGNDAPCESANPNWIEDSQYFVDNGEQPQGDIQFPGMTVTLTAFAEVICGETYHIKLAIGDASDGALDSGVFLEAGSFTSNSAVAVNFDVPVGLGDSTLYEGCGEALLQFVRPTDGIEETAYLNIMGSAINGVDFIPALPDSIVFPAGVDTLNFSLFAPADANFEGQETVTIEITNIASSCSGAVLTSEFTFFLNEADPLGATGFDGALDDCNDEIELFPTVTGGYGEYQYSWSNNATNDTITVSPGFTTTYFLTVSDTCGTPPVQTSFEVTVPTYPPIIVDLGDDFQVEECDVTVNLVPQVSGGFGSYDFQWIANNQPVGNLSSLNYLMGQNTEFDLIVTDDCGATGSDELIVTVPEVEVTAFLPDVFEASSCLEEIILPAISDGGIGTRTHTWTVDGEVQAVTTTNFFVYHPLMGQNVVMRAEDECQNSAVDSTFIPFNFPEVVIRTSPDTAICPKTEALLRVEVLEGSGSYDIRWEGSDTTMYLVAPRNSQNYTVVVTDTCGMSAEARINVEVREVLADFDYEYLTYYGLALTNYSRAVNPTYVWDFGDGNTSTEANPRHFYNDIEEYEVVLTTIDDIGCTDTAKLETIPPLEIFIPTSFTPNGDGINDLFEVVGTNLYEFEMKIFDRWGKVVFESNDIADKWNGSNMGDDYQSQTQLYNYWIRYKGKKEEDAVEMTGSITVIR